jgi:hypothetical protein
MTEIVGTDGEFTTDEITFQIRNIIVQEFSRVAGSGIPVLDMAANTADWASWSPRHRPRRSGRNTA